MSGTPLFLNYDVQNHSGPQVLKFIRTNYPNQRVILVLNDKQRYDSGEVTEENLQKLGAHELLIRPFEMGQLKEVLEGHQSLGDLMADFSCS